MKRNKTGSLSRAVVLDKELLLQVNKPGRYIGREWNVSQKEFDSAEIKFALCFPELYEVGMSNLGVRILYGIVNSLERACCERFFSPELDMRQAILDKELVLSSLESGRPLNGFDIVGFSLGHELCYSNVLDMLELGKVPLNSSERDNRHPLLIGGGPCAVNPEPMADFFDLFVIGEAEEAIVELIELYRRQAPCFRKGSISKEALLLELSQIEGAYAPSLYEVEYDAAGRIREFRPKISKAPSRIKKRFIKDLDSAYFPSCWLVPYIQIIHDRINLEIMRGCPNACRFCQARQQYWPFRLRSKEKIVELAEGAYRLSGYEDISLAGLSASDYPGINELIENLVEVFKERAVGISVPSIKIRPEAGAMSAQMARIKKGALTFAPEAASERLRRIINKELKNEEFESVLLHAYAAGYRQVKLYFMVGLPGEVEDDLKAIIDFSQYVSRLSRKVNKPAARVNVSVNTLIPKPHTAFQWLGMTSLKEIEEKQALLKSCLPSNKIKLDFHRPQMSLLEAVLSRGDRRLAAVILAAHKRGAHFDSWSNHFNLDIWLQAFAECGIEPEVYLREKEIGEPLPWDFLETGVSRSSLEQEYKQVERSFRQTLFPVRDRQ